MKPWNAWLCGLGLAGICVIGLSGCGGGDVPDASDAGQEVAGDAPSEPTAPPPPPAAAAPAPVAAAPAPAETAPAPAAVAAAPAPAETAESRSDPTPAPSQAESKSETAEMLAIATGPNPSAPKEEAETGQGRQGPGGMMMGPGGGMMGPGGGMMPPMGGPPGGQGSASQMEMMARMGPKGNGNMMGGPPGMNPGGMADMMAAQAQGMQGGRGPGSAYGGPGGSGGPGGGKEEGDTTSPNGAVKMFLSALKAKDRDRLAEATALRAGTIQEGGKYRDMFSRIIDSSISESELNDLADRFKDFKVSGENQPKSTGMLKITTRKTGGKNGGYLQRTFTVRREKKGWGVLDIGPQVEFKGFNMGNRRQGARKKN